MKLVKESFVHLLFCRSKHSSNAAKNNTFETYLTTSEVMAGLETNALIKGAIRINQRNYKEAYINSPVGLPTHWILLLLLAVQSIMNYGFFCYYLPLIQILWFLPPVLNVHYLQIFHWIQLPSNRYAYLASTLGLRECYTLSSKDLKISKYFPSTQTLHFFSIQVHNTFWMFLLFLLWALLIGNLEVLTVVTGKK